MRRLIAVVLGALALSGCAAMDQAGQAAFSDSFRVPQSAVDEQVRQVLQSVAQPDAEPPEALALATIQRLVQDQLIEAKSTELGLEVTPAEVDRAVEQLVEQSGGPEALAQFALQQGIPQEAIKAQVRSNLLLSRIGPAVAKDGDAAAQQDATQQALTQLSQSIDLQVAPRYGTWDHALLAVNPTSPVVGSAPQAPGPAQPATPGGEPEPEGDPAPAGDPVTPSGQPEAD